MTPTILDAKPLRSTLISNFSGSHTMERSGEHIENGHLATVTRAAIECRRKISTDTHGRKAPAVGLRPHSSFFHLPPPAF
jgi:hypothetical protein